MQERVKASLTQAADWLASTQLAGGSWPSDESRHSEPEDYMTDFVSTAQSTCALILSGNGRHAGSVLNGMGFCADYPLEESDPAVWYAWKLRILKLFNTQSGERQTKLLIRALSKKQDAQGFWKVFPTTLNATNFAAISALSVTDAGQQLSRMASWIRRTQKRDGGWSRSPEVKKSEPPSTGDCILSLLLCEDAQDSKAVRAGIRFLLNSQQASGGWVSPRIGKQTVYAAAISTLTLLVTGNDSAADKGISFLLDSQAGEGGWPYMKGEKPMYYTTYFATLALAFWLRLQQSRSDQTLKKLSDSVTKQEFAAHLFRQFDAHIRERFGRMLITGMLDSKAMGSTKDAIRRRRDILKALSEGGPGDTAEVIDRLKLRPEYEHLSKKSHITQIKADLDYLKDINLVSLVRYRYAVVKDFLRGDY